jgi:pantothenate synthetase
VALVSVETLAPVERVQSEVLALVAARVGTTRLIDNHRLMPARVTAGATDNGRQ